MLQNIHRRNKDENSGVTESRVKAGIAVHGTPSHSYGVSLAMITQFYLPPDTSEHTPPSPQPVRPVLDLPTPEGWKAELT